MMYCVFDLECTCWEYFDSDKKFHEIIEIGVALLDENLNFIRSASFFIRPANYPQLTTYCTQLTGISQDCIDDAPLFGDSFRAFTAWIGETSNIIPCSWGNFDKECLSEECARHNCCYPFSQDHVNIKQVYLDKLKRSKGGLQKACRVLNLPFEGTPHNGKDDAIMAAKVLKLLSTIATPIS